MNGAQGIAIICDLQGTILNILHNPPELEIPIQVGMPFARLAAGGSLAKALSFLLEIRTNRITFDWEINIAAKDNVLTLHFAGGGFEDNLLITGSETNSMARRLFEELVLITNEQTNALRSSHKEKAVSAQLYDEITRLNNEQANLQRELAKKNAELEHLYALAQKAAVTDSLTEVFNRRGFFDLCEREFERARRYKRPVSIIMFDLDHFKKLNDTYGHAVGDFVLRETAQRCFHSLRKVDVIGRYGGEEFVILLPETLLENACLVAERLRTLANEPLTTDGKTLTVSISLGVAQHTGDAADLDTLLRNADVALYQAKEAGRNCVRSFIP